MRTRLIIVSLCAWTQVLVAGESIESAYERARSVLPGNLKGLVRNETVQAHWFPTGDSFWYQRDSDSGVEYVIVDAWKGDKRKAFDHQRLVEAVSAVTGMSADAPVDPRHLLVTGMSRQNGELEISLAIGAKSVTCNSSNHTCSENASPGPAMNLLISPGGESAAFVRDNNLWLKTLETEQERQLTGDGEPYFAYGVRPDQQRFDELRAGTEFPVPPMSTYWSPNGQKLVVQRLDERQVLAYPFLEMAPENGGFRPVSYSVRIPLLGDSGDRESESFVIDVKSGKKSLIKLEPGFGLDDFGVGNAPIAWSPDGTKAFMLTVNAGASTEQLVEMKLDTGETRVLIEEKAFTSVALNHGLINPNVRVLNNSPELIWFSERDGWGHLHLHDLANGTLKNPITSGNWLVWDILHVDEARRLVFFTAGGRESGRDPYYRHLYKASLDGGEIILLTPENADHNIGSELSPTRQRFLAGIPGGESGGDGSGFFIDTYSTVDQAPVTVLRSLEDGHVISRLEEADVSGLYAAGWKAPQRFSVKAADGVTDIRGVLYLPSGFDPKKSYPVIDAIYGGPVSIVAARSFKGAYNNGYFPASVAELGFAVVTLDGRGTPYRSRAFREAGYGSFADPQLDDHVTAIRQLAGRFSFLDISRVGVYGHSNGGYLSARALLKHPDIFKVGFASAGPQNFQGLPGTGAPWFGVPDYGDGDTLRPEINAVPENYVVLDNSNFADQLQGRLMLVCGELDYTAFPALTMQLASALIKANKNFDMFYLPGSTHRYFVDDLYVTRRLWDYFVEHLAGLTPPDNFDMNSPKP
jgi:dipeptidyl aminopeptidase/acylaminoacyl peptidase